MSDLSEALPIAETFFSIQGEGPTMGIPSVFLRLSHCNLRCPAWGPPGSPQGCDTTDVWSKVWRRMHPVEILEYWHSQGWYSHLRANAHLVVTGGEPMLWQKWLPALFEMLSRVYIEVETNTTMLPLPPFDVYVKQYNCSPKLRSAGNPIEKAYVPKVLEHFARDTRAIFKFVVQDGQRDVDEIVDSYLHPFNIAKNRVWLMPEGATRERLLEHSPEVAEICKRYGFNFSSRLQLVLYDRATGV